MLAVVVAYGHADAVSNCVKSLQGQQAIRRVIVVDNSRDSAIAEVCETHGAYYLDPGNNVGYAQATRLGIDASTGSTFSHVLIANPDLVLFDLAPLIAALEDPATVIATGCLSNGVGEIDANARAIATPLSELGNACFGTTRLARRRPSLHGRSEVIGQAGGSLLLLRFGDWTNLLGFDERFELYYEDVDLCRRARERGRVIRVHTLVGSHVGGMSYRSNPGRGYIVSSISRIRYLRKWYGWQGAAAAATIGLIEFGARTATGQSEGQRVRWQALRRQVEELLRPGSVKVLSSRPSE